MANPKPKTSKSTSSPKAEIKKAAGEARDAARDRAETAQLHALELKDTIADHAETAQLHAMDMQDQFGEFVRRQPVASVGLAVGAGILIGALAARRG